jgi:hypothetical protein
MAANASVIRADAQRKHDNDLAVPVNFNEQLGEFADQKALQDYADCTGSNMCGKARADFASGVASLVCLPNILATVGTEHRIRRVLLFSSAIQRAELETSRRVGKKGPGGG